MTDVVIASAARTPVGSFNGALAPLAASELGSIAIREPTMVLGVGTVALETVPAID